MKILAVCGLGQGTSLILRMNIEAVLKELEIDAEVEHIDVSSAKTMHADFVVTSSELAETLGDFAGEILIVNNYFDLNEIKEVLQNNIKG